jgi:ribonuclease BN (tRNA processing enzyme)
LHAGQCGQVAREAGVGQLVLSHFYPLADRYDVKDQAGERYGGKIRKGKDLMTIAL